jgi:hypothetical protein
MSVKPEDLNREQRKAYDTWRSIGLTEAAAMNALVEDGLVELSEEETLAKRFQAIFPGTSDAAAKSAARGRDGGPSARPVSEANTGDNQRLIALIEQWQQDLLARGQLCIDRGESREQAALKEAFGKVFLSARNLAESAWILGVATARWPELATRRESSGGSEGGSGSKTTQSRTVGETTRQSGRRTVSE